MTLKEKKRLMKGRGKCPACDLGRNTLKISGSKVFCSVSTCGWEQSLESFLKEEK